MGVPAVGVGAVPGRLRRLFAFGAVSVLASTAAPATGQPTDPAQVGAWEIVPNPTHIHVIHAAMLRTGKVLLIEGSGNDPAQFEAGRFRTALFDPRTERFERIPTPWDAFCAGHTFLADGRLLVAGGTKDYPTDFALFDWKGSPRAYLFDPVRERYVRVRNMAHGRWYPTLVTLGDGRAYALAGLNERGDGDTVVPEVFTRSGRWRSLPPTHDPWPLYPHLFLMRDGRLFFSGGVVFEDRGVPPGILDPRTSDLTPVEGLTGLTRRNQSASVLLPPAQDQRVMIMGGANPDGTPAVANVDVIDLDAADPAYAAGPPLHVGRVHLSAVLLPDRTVLVTGGGASREADPVFETEIYDPVANTWGLVAPSSVPRLYHSVAVLLPDGRVLTAGSNPEIGVEELRIEIYSPPYLFRGERPAITSAPREISYGDTIELGVTDPGAIEAVHLIRPTAVTHSMDTEQRLVAIAFELIGETLHATVPSERTIAPPGWYMLFVENGAGVPSVARWVHLS